MLSDGDTVTVYLVTSNVHGCQNDTDKVTFITYVDPVVDFSISPLTGCHTLTVNIDTTGISTTETITGKYIKLVGLLLMINLQQ